MPDQEINQSLSIRIISPQQLFYDGAATSISSKNSAGNFDVLPAHANFITVIDNQPIVVRPTSGKPLTFKFPLAILYCSNNKVSIFTYVQPELKETLKQ